MFRTSVKHRFGLDASRQVRAMERENLLMHREILPARPVTTQGECEILHGFVEGSEVAPPGIGSMDVALRSTAQGRQIPTPRKCRVLIVDDDRALAETLGEGLFDRGYDAVTLASSNEAARRLGADDVDALVTDLRMPGVDGLGLLELSRRAAPERPVIVMTAYSAVESAIESIRRGAYHYLTKPFKVDELALFLDRALAEARLRGEARVLRRALRDQFAIGNVIGRSGSMRELCELAARVTDASTPVLIIGETGTGKGLFARALHGEGPRAHAPFVTINCAAVPQNLLESELFGHTRGAFTGATGPRKGLFEEASGGTVFLDEIGELPLALQAKLLDVLERGVVRALGADRERPIDARVIAATHRNLRARVREGKFREDLLFRLDVVRLEIPPLRQRLEDLPLLIAHFLAQAKARHPGSPVEGLGHDALARLMAHPWPGNVRELENAVERVVLLGRGAEVGTAELPAEMGLAAAVESRFEGPVISLDELERRYARWAMSQLGGRKMLTAEKLGIDRKTLSKLLDESMTERNTSTT
ncbi:MAG TPA: sigma-54 dependent transcriptional regulator [Polyangiaceae bacterium]|nr:sigma-54 dependent transcriptional regulator [Polyangiaceae bacterium]